MTRRSHIRVRRHGVTATGLVRPPPETTARTTENEVALNIEEKTGIITKHAREAGDTGSPEVQVALMTARIEYLTTHLQTHSKDHASRRGLLKLVGQRRKLLKYLRTVDQDRYTAVIGVLGLRR